MITCGYGTVLNGTVLKQCQTNNNQLLLVINIVYEDLEGLVHSRICRVDFEFNKPQNQRM